MRQCVICGEEKELEMFRKRQIWFSHTCKACYASQYRTGKPNTGRFVKGHKPIAGYEKGNIPWTTGKKHSEETRLRISLKKKGIKLSNEHRKKLSESHPKPSINRAGVRNKKWRVDVKERDVYKCMNCGTNEKLHAHHIIPWKQDISKRFELDNGITLCASCHKKEDGCTVAGWNKGLKHSDEWCENLSKSCKGRKAWNKGLKKEKS